MMASQWYVEALDRVCGKIERTSNWESYQEGIVLRATGYYAKGMHIDVPLIYGDYYFAEALGKLNGLGTNFW